MSLAGLLHQGREYLGQRGLEEAPLEAEVLLMHLRGISRAYLYAHGEEPVAPEEAEAFRALLGRRARHEPLAYITGEREFFGLSFYVDPRTLIPRPETEVLVEECLKRVDGATAVADIGTGCGAIAITLARHLPPRVAIYTTDISLEALQVAATNRRRHGLESRVHLLWGDLLQPLPHPVDTIVANLPYVPTSVLPTLAPEISRFEPKEALDGGADGLETIRRLLGQVADRLRPGGLAVLEVGADQSPEVVREAQGHLPGSAVRVVRDLAGRDRVVVIETAA